MDSAYRSNNNIVFCCNYHVVFCPKYRRSILHGEVEKRLKEIVREVCDERDAKLIEVECDKDHVHMLISIDPQYGIHKLVKQIKGRSSYCLRSEFPDLKRKMPSMWTNSYFVSTVGGVTLEVVKKYVENQKLRSESWVKPAFLRFNSKFEGTKNFFKRLHRRWITFLIIATKLHLKR